MRSPLAAALRTLTDDGPARFAVANLKDAPPARARRQDWALDARARPTTDGGRDLDAGLLQVSAE